MFLKDILLAMFLFAAHSVSHPTFYNLTMDDDEICHSPDPAPIRSWHIHVHYWGENKKSVESAHRLRERFIKRFKDELGPECESPMHNDYMCMLGDRPVPGGPFLTAQWAVFLLPEHFEEAVSWMAQHRHNHDVLLHPNSGCIVPDHTHWAFWLGDRWKLDLSIFEDSINRPFHLQEQKNNDEVPAEK